MDIDACIKLRDQLKGEKAAKPPINLVPFYLNPQMLLWLGIYSVYMILIYLLVKQDKHVRKIKFGFKHLWLSLLVYVFYEWPLWVRNFILNTKGRTVYAYPNFDIDKVSFFYQEVIIFFFCFLSAQLILICVDKYNKINSTTYENVTVNEFLVISSYYSTAYRDWFINSVLLAIGFLSFTSFFWRIVFAYGDQRYLISAVNAHVIWALAWIAISLNFFYYMQLFDKIKREILRTNPDDKTLKIVMEHAPASNMTVVLSGIVSLLTFLSPLLKMLFEK
jgi:hypothetical protein